MKHSSSKFQALDIATRACAACIDLSGHIQNPFGDVVSQLTRAALSIPLNLTEGAGRQGRDRKHFYRIAYGSARECMKIVEILMNLDRVDPKQAQRCLDLLDRVGAMCWRLTN